MGIRNPDLKQPYGEWEEVDVVFPATPGTDLVVPHSLHAAHPDSIRYHVVRASAAAHVYHDTSATRKSWQPTYILLRSDVASVRMTLLLSTTHEARPLAF